MILLKKVISHNLPSGNFNAVLHQVLEFTRMVEGKEEKVMRLDWRVTSILHPRYSYHAGKSYKESKPEVLAADLESWLGNRINNLLDEDGALTKEALEELIGEAADIQIVHIDNDQYDHPFCHVKIVAPPGTLTSQRNRKAA